jgi:UDP-glucose 4-epimerase
MTWSVAGGVGYIGSHAVRAFGQVGLGVVVPDDLGTYWNVPTLVDTGRARQGP